MKIGLIKTDEHQDSTKPFNPAYLLLKKFAKHLKPDFVVDLGDWLDMAYIASFNKERLDTISGMTFKDDYDLGKRELDFWQSVTPKLYMIQGNHDERTERLIDAVPAFKGLIDYHIVFDFEGRGIEYRRILDEPLRIGKLTFIHGWYTNKYHAAKHLDVYSGNICYGHCHRFMTISKNLAHHNEEIQAWCIGGLCDKAPDYMKGRPTGWQNGFAIMYLQDNGDFNLYPINIINGGFVWEGRKWEI